jgi:hypothetical protein
MHRLAATALAAIAIGGCTTQTTALGHTPAVQVHFTTPESIKLLWDPARFSESSAESMASAYCKGGRVKATDGGSQEGFIWKTWTCA